MIREDRELLAELARLNKAMAPFAMRIMEGTATTTEQQSYAHRLTAAGQRLQRRIAAATGTVVDGEVVANEPIALFACTSEPDAEL